MILQFVKQTRERSRQADPWPSANETPAHTRSDPTGQKFGRSVRLDPKSAWALAATAKALVTENPSMAMATQCNIGISTVITALS